MIQKKNSFWTFVFSFFPGAGEMYMGFMKMGVSIMGMFFLIITVASTLEIGPLVFLALIVWFYGFFHVHNLAGMPDEEFYALEDKYLFCLEGFGEQGREIVSGYRRTIAVVLIFIGALMIWRGLFRVFGVYLPDYIYGFIRGVGYRLPQVVVGIGIVLLGVLMIRGKKQQLYKEESGEKTDPFETQEHTQDTKSQSE